MAASAPTSPSGPGVVGLDTIARFRDGDREAFLIVYDTFAPQLRPLVARFFPRPFECEEATQEVWLLVHRMAAKYDAARGELLPWLRKVAVNRCKELLRARGRRPDARVSLQDDGTHNDGVHNDSLHDFSDPEAAARAERLCTAVARFSATLRAEEATVFRMSLLEERSHHEVAVAAGISERRCKYLRMKLLARAAAHPDLHAALREVIES